MSRVWNLSKDRKLYLSNGANPITAQFLAPPVNEGALSRLTVLRGESFWTPIPVVGGSGGGGYATGSEPWRLAPGESIYDRMPTGVPVVDIEKYSTSRDLPTALRAVEAAETRAVYVQLRLGDYFVNSLQNVGTATNPNWLGFNNGSRRVMGLIGAGFDDTGEFLTRVISSDTMVSSSPDSCRTFLLNATKAVGPVPVTALYFSNTNTNVPLFFSGITFDGKSQGPFGVFSTAAQAAFNTNAGATSPLPWKGVSVWRAVPGALMQFCRFRGFSHALTSAPPFECGTVDTNYTQLATRRIELDGRLAGYVNAARPRVGGGFMWNKELNASMKQSWMHHTRRSGMATNTNTHSTTEKYTFETYQSTDIANIDSSDVWPSDAGATPGFNAWNVEAVMGTFSITDGYANSTQGHVAWALPYSDGGVPNVLPDQKIIQVKGFRTDDTLYNGCLRVSISQRPNSTGQSPIWTALNADFAGACAKYFDIRSSDGTPLAPVRASTFNPAIHGPKTHYVHRSF